MTATIQIFPDRAARARDEKLLALMAQVEALGVVILDPEELSLADFLSPPSDGDKRAFERLAGAL